MTIISGLVDRGRVYLGGDSAGVGDGYGLSVRADQKVFRNGDFVMGFTTSFRMGQLLQHVFKPPRRHPDDEVYAFMVRDFVDAVRACFKTGGYARASDGAEYGGTFLVGYAGRLFRIDDDYHVGEAADGFDACGCATDVALGSLWTSRGAPRKRLITAMEAAERYSAGVRGPFAVVATEAA